MDLLDIAGGILGALFDSAASTYGNISRNSSYSDDVRSKSRGYADEMRSRRDTLKSDGIFGLMSNDDDDDYY